MCILLLLLLLLLFIIIIYYYCSLLLLLQMRLVSAAYVDEVMSCKFCIFFFFTFYCIRLCFGASIFSLCVCSIY